MAGELLPLDLSAALDRVGGDEELLRDIADLFLSEYPEQLDEIRTAVAAHDAKRLERSAHSLKGAVSNFGANAAFEAALELEHMGRRNEVENATRALVNLEAHLATLHPALAAILK